MLQPACDQCQCIRTLRRGGGGGLPGAWHPLFHATQGRLERHLQRAFGCSTHPSVPAVIMDGTPITNDDRRQHSCFVTRCRVNAVTEATYLDTKGIPIRHASLHCPPFDSKKESSWKQQLLERGLSHSLTFRRSLESRGRGPASPVALVPPAHACTEGRIRLQMTPSNKT
ncbi:uncharacterized protein LY79DRAFT_303496 [Colletotrichum navitas]|uniref:Uncharacterized protein n=1 Tax=Colletotrichum navitas TaxID=681940 RepID=A0AAD8PTN4_9PEZI|nr:uncharacterized protein LY79DRAFT_303496 [Colletotrichum navitas]KAK1580546.1 hypothetical protein LY79DRAFT_303496 [Colletotrichum navitas]